MKKMSVVSRVALVFCFGLHVSQVLGSDNDRAQLDALSKKSEREDEVRRKRESLEGKVVPPAESFHQGKSSLEQWKHDYDKEQERIKSVYED